MARKILSQVTRPDINAQGRIMGYWTDTYYVDQPDPTPTQAPVQAPRPPQSTPAVAPQTPRHPKPLELTPKQFHGLMMMRLTAGVPALPPSTLDLILEAQKQKKRHWGG